MNDQQDHRLCRNCAFPAPLPYCGQCGQKTEVKRLDLKWLVSEGLADVAHFTRRFFFTASSMLTDPGVTILEYLSGKRTKYQGPIAYFVIASLLLTVFLKFVAEPNGWHSGSLSTKSRDIMFMVMVGMALMAYWLVTRTVLTLVETIVAFCYLYGTLFVVAPAIVALQFPLRVLMGGIESKYKFLVVDVPNISFVIYMGARFCIAAKLSLYRLAMLGGIAFGYHLFVREILGYR